MQERIGPLSDHEAGAPAQPGTPLHIGLFDIMQVDPVLQESPSEMFARRLDDLALADELGYDIAFCAERHFLAAHVIPSATAWLAAASQRATRLRLGALGYTLPIRVPVQLAEELAMLDQLTNGRLEVGFGLGHRVEELVALGVDPEERVSIYQERLALLEALWSGGVVSFEHDDTRLREVAIHPLPAQSPYPPLWHAGTEPLAAHWVGSQGMGLAVGFRPTEQLRPAVAAWHAGRNLAGEELRETWPARPTGAVALMRHVYVAESDEQAMREIRDDLVRLGELNDANRQRGLAERKAEAEVHAQELIETEVMIAGGPETVASAILKSRDLLLLDLFLANVYAAGVDKERIRRTLRLLAGEVRERVNDAIAREGAAAPA